MFDLHPSNQTLSVYVMTDNYHYPSENNKLMFCPMMKITTNTSLFNETHLMTCCFQHGFIQPACLFIFHPNPIKINE